MGGGAAGRSWLLSTRVEGEAARDVECERDGGMCPGDGRERIVGGERQARMGLAGCGWESREREFREQGLVGLRTKK
ncbi:hypothetical protein AAC387_Pa08g0499 [Persea americana]